MVKVSNGAEQFELTREAKCTKRLASDLRKSPQLQVLILFLTFLFTSNAMSEDQGNAKLEAHKIAQLDVNKFIEFESERCKKRYRQEPNLGNCEFSIKQRYLDDKIKKMEQYSEKIWKNPDDPKRRIAAGFNQKWMSFNKDECKFFAQTAVSSEKRSVRRLWIECLWVRVDSRLAQLKKLEELMVKTDAAN
jgi:hypothetical protein